MRIAFLGTAAFSVPSLRAVVAAGHEVTAVVTQPDRPGDRGRPAARPVGDAADALGLRILRPVRLRSDEAAAALLATAPDALVVAAYGQILPASLLAAPRHGGINVHASLLPRWRGAAPVNAAIRAGDPLTGVSIMAMDAGLDTGAVYAALPTPIGASETAPELTGRLADLGASLLVDVLAAIEAGRQPPPVPQDEAASTLAPRLTRDDGRVDWALLDAAAVDRHIRAMTPWPGSAARLGGETVRLVAGEALPAVAASGPAPGASVMLPAAPGTVVGIAGEALVVSTAAGDLRVDVVQPPGRRPMAGAAWLRGRRLVPPVPPG